MATSGVDVVRHSRHSRHSQHSWGSWGEGQVGWRQVVGHTRGVGMGTRGNMRYRDTLLGVTHAGGANAGVGKRAVGEVSSTWHEAICGIGVSLVVRMDSAKLAAWQENQTMRVATATRGAQSDQPLMPVCFNFCKVHYTNIPQVPPVGSNRQPL